MNADQKLDAFLAEHGLSNCKECGRKLDRGDCAWNSGSTEAGTEYSTLMITCQQCDTEAVLVHSWMPWIDDFEDFVGTLISDYRGRGSW